MEERLLQCYLKYLKDRHKSDKILDFIRMLIIPMLLWLVALLLTVPSLAFSATHPYITLFCFALQLFFIYSMREYVNRFNIQNSVASFENYRQHCEELARWLRSKCKIDPESVIMQEMIPKIECMAEEIKTEREKKESRTEKILYAVLIPIVLIILTELVRDKDFAEVLSVSVRILAIFFLLYVVIQGVVNIKVGGLHKKEEQFKSFAADLRAVQNFRRLEQYSDNHDNHPES